MMTLGRLKGRRRDALFEHFTVLDLGTDFVKALVVKREDGAGSVLGAARQRQAASAMAGGAVADIDSVVETCNVALEAAEDMGEAIPGQVVMGVAGEFVSGFSTSVSYPRPQSDARIGESELQQVLELVQKRSLRQAATSLSLDGAPGAEVKLVNSAITSVRIDGQRITNPIGFQGKNVEVSVFNTFAPLTLVGAVEAVAAELDLELLALVAMPFAIARACSPADDPEAGGIYVDIGGGTTDVALVRNGAIESCRTFGLAGRIFTRRVANELGLRLGQAEEAKLRYSDRRMEADQLRALRLPVGRDVELLVEALGIVLEEMSRGEPLPSTLHLCGGGSQLPEIEEALAAFPWTQRLPMAREPVIHRLRPGDVSGVYDSSGRLLTEQDVPPMCLAHTGLRHQDDGEALMNQLMRRILRAMKI